MIWSSVTTAQSPKVCNKELQQACTEALKKADVVILDQDKLIQKLTQVNEKMKSENDRLAEAVVADVRLLDKQTGRYISLTLGGILLGIVAGSLLSK